MSVSSCYHHSEKKNFLFLSIWANLHHHAANCLSSYLLAFKFLLQDFVHCLWSTYWNYFPFQNKTHFTCHTDFSPPYNQGSRNLPVLIILVMCSIPSLLLCIPALLGNLSQQYCISTLPCCFQCTATSKRHFVATTRSLQRVFQTFCTRL